MRRRVLSRTAIRHAAIALILVVSLAFVGAPPVAAGLLDTYFDISYSFTLYEDEVYYDDIFYANVTGEATCIDDLPMGIEAYEAEITFRIVAEPQAGGDSVTLNAGYTVTIDDFPEVDETIEIDEDIPLQFPDGSASGIYDLVAELVTATVETSAGTFTVTSMLPASQDIDTVTYTGATNSPPYQPGSPSPANHATGVSINADLSWTGGDPDAGDTVTYDVYFGTGTTPPLVSEDQTGTIYDPGTLSYNTKYYWKIIAEDNHAASTTGAVWDFTTREPNHPPNTPGSPSPANHATGVPINADLSWTGGDPDAGDTVTYDVYFGTSTTPPLVSQDQAGTTYDPGALSHDTTYHWKIVAEDNYGASTESTPWDFVTAPNNPPNTPSSPSPANHATGVSINADLSWTGGDPDAGDTVTYDVYFGTGATPPLVSGDQTGTSYDPGTLSHDSTYHWKIIAQDNYGASTGSAPWDFATAPNNPPNTPGSPSPANHATGVSINADLGWTGGDPDAGDTVTYDVYFGTGTTPPLVSGDQTGTTYDPGTLSQDTTYHWKIIAQDNYGASTGSDPWDFVTASNSPPNQPSDPSPANHSTGVPVHADLDWTGGDPDAGDIVTYDVYFGTSATPPLVSQNQTGAAYNPDTLSYNTKYYWMITAEDNHAASTTGPVWDFTTGSSSNSPPNKPSAPSGPGYGYTGTSYSYSTSVTDPDGDQVKYTFDWRDDTTSETGLVGSGTTASRSHAWSSPGTYYIKAKATDSEGASSGWSISKKVTISTAPNNPPNQPGSPSPANHATGVPVNADLGWTGGDPDAGDTVTYDVYFGTSATPPLVSQDQTGTTYDPGTLSYNTKYYWKITAEDNHAASTMGPVWDFTTAGEWDPWAYDENSDGIIQKMEAIHAIQDYFNQEITKAQAIEVIMLYFG